VRDRPRPCRPRRSERRFRMDRRGYQASAAMRWNRRDYTGMWRLNRIGNEKRRSVDRFPGGWPSGGIGKHCQGSFIESPRHRVARRHLSSPRPTRCCSARTRTPSCGRSSALIVANHRGGVSHGRVTGKVTSRRRCNLVAKEATARRRAAPHAPAFANGEQKHQRRVKSFQISRGVFNSALYR
jgi:hypothetical protein